MEIFKYLGLFDRDIEKFQELGTNELGYDNVAIAGSCALQLHGINVPWKTGDLDVVIFCPTDLQRDFVNDTGQPCASYHLEEELRNKGEDLRAFMYEKGAYVMNVIFEKEPTPPDLLQFAYKDFRFQVNRVDRIIAAKLSYAKGHDKIYMRRKDVDHIIQLKNQNFNL